VIYRIASTWSISKGKIRKFDTEGFNLKKLYYMEVKEQNQIKVSKKSATLENLGGGGDMESVVLGKLLEKL